MNNPVNVKIRTVIVAFYAVWNDILEEFKTWNYSISPMLTSLNMYTYIEMYACLVYCVQQSVGMRSMIF